MTERSFDDLFPTRESGGHEPRRSDLARPDEAYRRPASTHPHPRTSTTARDAASPYQDFDRYRRVQAQPKRTGRRALGIVASLLVLVAFGIGAYFVV